MAETVLSGVLAFMGRLGVYDVILPFLLVFTLMYAILEKSKVLGTEKLGGTGDETTKKNLNAMASFVIAFLVVASSQLVEIITTISAKIVVLLFILVFFLMLVGSFYGKDEDVKLVGWQRTLFFVIVLVAVALIAFDSITVGGNTLLEWVWGFITSFWTSAAAATVIFVVLLIAFMGWITKTPTTSSNGDKKENGKK